MFTAIINGIFKVVMTLVQVLALPFNLVVNTAFPSLSDTIISVSNGLSSLFSNILSFVYILPAPVLTALTFIFSIELILLTTGIIIWGVQRSLIILQKIKFW